MNVVWDADGTLWTCIFDINFPFYFEKMKYHQYVDWHRKNPLVRKDDVKIVLTGRYSSMREKFINELKVMNFSPDIIIMNPFDNKNVNLEWKSHILNEIRADIYIDDDPFFCKNLQKLTPFTKCISTHDYYWTDLKCIKESVFQP